MDRTKNAQVAAQNSVVDDLKAAIEALGNLMPTVNHSCRPDAGCDGHCAEAHYYGMIYGKALNALSTIHILSEPSDWAKEHVRRVDNGQLGWTPKLRADLASALLGKDEKL